MTKVILLIGEDFPPSEPIVGGRGVLARVDGNRCQISFLGEQFNPSWSWDSFNLWLLKFKKKNKLSAFYGKILSKILVLQLYKKERT